MALQHDTSWEDPAVQEDLDLSEDEECSGLLADAANGFDACPARAGYVQANRGSGCRCFKVAAMISLLIGAVMGWVGLAATQSGRGRGRTIVPHHVSDRTESTEAVTVEPMAASDAGAAGASSSGEAIPHYTNGDGVTCEPEGATCQTLYPGKFDPCCGPSLNPCCEGLECVQLGDRQKGAPARCVATAGPSVRTRLPNVKPKLGDAPADKETAGEDPVCVASGHPCGEAGPCCAGFACVDLAYLAGEGEGGTARCITVDPAYVPKDDR